MDTSQYVSSMFTLLGIVLAAIIATSSYLLRWKHEYRKSARRALYLLLQIRNSAIDSIFSPADATEAYIEHLLKIFKEKGIPASKDDVNEEMTTLISNHFQNLIDAIRQEIEGSTLEQYEKALYELSAQNPVLAYQLQGKEKFQKLLDITQTYNKNVLDELNGQVSAELALSLASTAASFEPEVQAEVIDILDQDIIKLSKYCGWSDHRRCKRQLANKSFKAKGYDFSDLDKIFANFLVVLSEHLQSKRL
ncbi:hypothetical protein [Vibrio cholerae]|uniref:hypothetical protein n=2 Tax=Vibrio cholerae TaxID=666 RepID=UPI0029341859|nr:hypothetical protein [Vibrio cholerae]EKF9742306.1 hypothetical protein [Vibrio cholerae]MDV2304616.1 hypothetical protein [Vibrio cholerae]MDV2337223.1 hypothetical protein [Vibrio cholerae]